MNIKVKRLLLLALLLGTTQIKAQQTTNLQLPVILPPAPNAAELGKYGNIPINHSTGSVNYNIPLLNVASGALKVNLSVAYNSGGIKVDQIASRAGMGWVLDAGGVINRTVYGDRDETALTAPIPEDVTFNTPEVISFLDRATLNKDKYDTQPDVFSFNFNGYSGKFILKPDDKTKVVFLSASNLKVQTNFNGLLGTGWTIKVIDPNGISYYFGGSTATEKSRTQNSGQGCGKTYDLGVENAWYLNKIEDLNGDNIVLSYLPVQITYYASASQTRVEPTPETRIAYIFNPTNGTTIYAPPGSQSNCITTILNTGVILDKIVTSKGAQAQFTYITRRDVEGDKLISKIEYGLVGKPFSKTFNFNYNEVLSDLSYSGAYSNGQLNYRPYLMDLTEWSEGLTTSKKHEFHYYNANALPPRLSYSQDHFGFFNGKSNFGFLPRPPMGGIFSYTPADRECNGNYAHYGMLSKVIYPTGGTDSLLYEANTIQEYISEHTVPKPFSVGLEVTGTGIKTSGIVTKTFPSDGKLIIGLYSSYSGVGVDDRIHQIVTLTIKELPSMVIKFEKRLLLDEMYRDSIALTPGNYEATLMADGQASLGNAYINGTYGTNIIPASSSVKVSGGARVKQVLTYDPVSNVNNVKSYYYNKYLQPTVSSGVLLKPQNNYFSMLEMRVTDPSNTISMFCAYHQASSNGDVSLFSNDGNHLLYTDVTVSDGTDFSNGATYYQYEINKERPSRIVRGGDVPFKPYDISGLPSVLERYQLVYKSGSPQPLKLKETFMTYKKILSETYVAYQGEKNYDVSAGGEAPYDLATYDVNSFWNYNDSTKVVTYDTQGINPATVITANLYQNPAHLQLTETNNNSSDGKKVIKRLLYPHEMVSSAQDPTGVYAAMIAKNKIAPVVEEKELNVAVVTDLKRTNYYQPYPNIFAAQSIATFNPVLNSNETRIKFNKYNAKGNVLNVSVEEGTKIGYLWSYNHQFPIAEIKGADQAQIEAALTVTAIDNFANLVAPDKTAIDNFLAPLKTAVPAAHISTFVYDPLKGLISQTDAKGMVTYYEYDSFQRLKTIKDHNQHIIKNYEYYYKP